MVGTFGIPEVVLGLVLLAIARPRSKWRFGLMAVLAIAGCLMWNIVTVFR